jgi:hypothetical protein
MEWSIASTLIFICIDCLDHVECLRSHYSFALVVFDSISRSLENFRFHYINIHSPTEHSLLSSMLVILELSDPRVRLLALFFLLL